MKAKELMIGDWVIDGYTNRPMRIEVLNKMMGSGLSPITLTAEILEKNGFKKEGMVGYVYNDGIHSESQVYVEIFFRWNGEVRVINILNHMRQYNNRNLPYGLFVHELQHALRLCGLNELANNFKI